jgi:hypothetical protein
MLKTISYSGLETSGRWLDHLLKLVYNTPPNNLIRQHNNDFFPGNKVIGLPLKICRGDVERYFKVKQSFPKKGCRTMGV